MLKVQIRSADGSVLGAVLETPPYKTMVLPHEDDKTFPLLRFVDLFGDTYFASLQLDAVTEELKRLQGMRLVPEQLEFLASVVDLARRCAEEPHQFLVFAGD